MNSKNCDMLTKNLDAKDEMELLRIVDGRIDEILSKSSNPKRSLEALICLYEGRNNIATSYTIMSIAYGVLVGFLTMWATSEVEKIFVAVLLIVAIVVLVIGSLIIYDYDTKRAFVLSVVKFRYDSICNQVSYANSDDDGNVKEYIVKVMRNE